MITAHQHQIEILKVGYNIMKNKIKTFFNRLIRAHELRGMQRAAEELRKLGYLKEYNEIINRIRKEQSI